MLDFGSFSHITAAGSQGESLGLEFIFSSDAAAPHSGGPGPHHGKPRPYRNPNRPGTPLAFWRKVKDALRFFPRRGAYTAPGPNGKRNNIERNQRPSGGGNAPAVLHGGGIARLPTRRPRLDLPPLPPFERPDSLPGTVGQVPTKQPPVATRLPPERFELRGKEVTLTPDKPIAYKQEVLFIEGTDEFINIVQARLVMSELLKIMQEHKHVHVTISGNAASDWKVSGTFRAVYGSDKALLMRSPEGGWYAGKPQWGPNHRSIGGLMLARARAIGDLLTSRGIARGRVHCGIGTMGYGTLDDPSSGARKRRATIVISLKP